MAMAVERDFISRGKGAQTEKNSRDEECEFLFHDSCRFDFVDARCASNTNTPYPKLRSIPPLRGLKRLHKGLYEPKTLILTLNPDPGRR